MKQNLRQMEHCAFSEVARLFQSVGCVTNSVSHISTESEIISLDARLRLDGIPVLDFWDVIVLVFGNTTQSHKEWGDLCTNQREVRSTPHTIQKRRKSQRVINDLDNVKTDKVAFDDFSWNQLRLPKSKYISPRTKWQTFWPLEISHVMNGIVFCVYSTFTIFSSINCSEKI